MSIQQDINDLDRMVDTDAQKDNIRSQIRLIAREVAALETDYSSLAQRHSEFVEAATKRIMELEEAQKNSESETAEKKRRAWREFAEKCNRANKTKTLNYNA